MTCAADRVPGGGQVVMQAGTALEAYSAFRHLYQSGRLCHMYNSYFNLAAK